MSADRELDEMRAWLREPRDYHSLEVNRRRIATRSLPFDSAASELPQTPCTALRAASYDR